MSKRGYKPVYNVIDNVETKAIKTYMESEKIEVQFVTPYDHRVNAAERAIQHSIITPYQACASAMTNFHQFYGAK